MDTPINLANGVNSKSRKPLPHLLPMSPLCDSDLRDLVKEERKTAGERLNYSPTSSCALQQTFLSPVTPGCTPIVPSRLIMSPPPQEISGSLRSPQPSPFGAQDSNSSSLPANPPNLSVQLSTSQYSCTSEASFFKYALRPGIHTSTPISRVPPVSPLLPYPSPPYLPTSPSPKFYSRPPVLPEPYIHIPTSVRPSVAAGTFCDQPLDLSMPSRQGKYRAPIITPIVITPENSDDDMMVSAISMKSEMRTANSSPVLHQGSTSGSNPNSTNYSRCTSESIENNRESVLYTPPSSYQPSCSPVTPVRNLSPMEVSMYPDFTGNIDAMPSSSTTMTPRARQILEKWYMWNNPTDFPSKEIIQALSTRTGMSTAVVTCWINSQRASSNSSSPSSGSSYSPSAARMTAVSRKRRASSSPVAPAAKRPFRSMHPVSTKTNSNEQSNDCGPNEIINFLYFIPSPCQYYLHNHARMVLESWYLTYRSHLVSFSTLQYLASQTRLPIEAVMHWVSHTVKMDTYRTFLSL